MRQLSIYLANVFTPPAIILNFAKEFGVNVNTCLVLIISILTIIFWCICINNQRLRSKKLKKEIGYLEKEIEFFDIGTENLKHKQK